MPAPPMTFVELIEQRAADSATRPMARHDGCTVTYGEFKQRSIGWAHWLMEHRRAADRGPKVAVMMRNNLAFLDLYGATAYAGGMLFGINNGLGGDTLKKVVAKAEADVVVADAANREALEAAGIDHVLVADAAARAGERAGRDAPEAPWLGAMSPWIVIYTSGTTGVPKGIVSSHGKLRAIGTVLQSMMSLTSDDVGYVNMPLFHSNAIYLNWMPVFGVGGSVVLRDKFSASSFVPDVFEHGCTFWNYVGQPVHYILSAIRDAYGGDEEKILSAVRDDPRNRMRTAVGTGATGAQRRKFQKWLGIDHVYELYGSTEAEISTYLLPGDPLDSVGQIPDPNIVILAEDGRECGPGEVGEIVRKGLMGLFQGYHGMPDASAAKTEGGVYRSGDLGYYELRDGKRYLYFVGRTDDWIRKDGENFSAEHVVEMVRELDAVDLAAAYGAPNPVSDEWVMVALRLRAGRELDPQGLYEHCRREVEERGRDAKWFPDLVRVVDDFTWTETHKIRVRDLKGVFFHPDHADRVFIRRRGDTTFEPLDRAGYERLAAEFEESGRGPLLQVPYGGRR